MMNSELSCAALRNAQVPTATFNYFDSEGTMQEVTSDELCNGKKVRVLVLKY